MIDYIFCGFGYRFEFLEKYRSDSDSIFFFFQSPLMSVRVTGAAAQD